MVRSAKEKRYEELKNIIKNIKNCKKNRDMANLLSSKCQERFNYENDFKLLYLQVVYFIILCGLQM